MVVHRREFLRRIAESALTFSAAPFAIRCAGDSRVRGAFRPNLLFIMADDLGYADLSITGRTDYTTPVIDDFARQGVRLTQAYSAAPVCSPTRVALMTGRYPARLEVGLHEPLTTHPVGLSPDLPTLSRFLKQAGYYNALVGKWHLGIGTQFHPLRHGFDEFYGFLGPSVDYVSQRGTETREHDFYDGESPVQPHGYMTDLLTARAVDIIKQQRSTPFFLSLQYSAPHWPWQAPGDPAYPDSLPWKAGGSAATFAAMMNSLDDGVGQVLQSLRDARIENDTLVVFTSDNGGELYSDMGPFRRGKMTLWEGGIRVAAFARWPGVIPAGITTDQVSITMDWTATLLGAASVAPDSTDGFDGTDIMPQLRGEAPTARECYWRTFQRSRHKATRHGDWKYLLTEDGEFLFDLAGDAGESRDRKADSPEIFARLKTVYAGWERQMLTPIPLDPRFA
jgi:arylsulfatase A-like enzyme